MRKAQGTISVFTFKDGILARAAHDLVLRLAAPDITLDGESVTAIFSLHTLRVVGPVEGGVVRAESYDTSRRAEVEQTMHTEILLTAQHPSARFDGRAIAHGNDFEVSGQLELAGKNAPITFAVHRDGDVYRARFDMQPTRWGIAPYRALLGAIKLKDIVRIELALAETRAAAGESPISAR